MYNNSIFYKNIEKDKEKLQIYNSALKEGKILPLDQTTLTRLRRLYYGGFYQAILYMYYEPTTFNNVGDKVKLLTYAMEDKEYKIIHGDTDSTRDIPFFMYNCEHLDFNSWIEVEEGRNVWVYDPFSLLKIDKETYYQLENPKIRKTISKDVIINHPSREEDDYAHLHSEFMLIGIIPQIENNINNHPFKEVILPELTRFKSVINYEDMVLEWNREEIEIKGKSFY